jgi:hypothetical protein
MGKECHWDSLQAKGAAPFLLSDLVSGWEIHLLSEHLDVCSGAGPHLNAYLHPCSSHLLELSIISCGLCL